MHSYVGINAFLIDLPSSSLMGMFCKFGSTDDSLPVLVRFWVYIVCTLSFWIVFISPSIYVEYSLVSFLYSIIFSIMGCFPFNLLSTSIAVELLFFLCGRFNFSNNISPNCLGDDILKLAPAISCISFVISSIYIFIFSHISFKTLLSIFTPVNSISASTVASGISISLNR